MSNQIVAGSLSSVARQTNRPVAEAFLDATTLCLLDVSASMSMEDSRGGRRRIDVAREELARLQAEFPGKIALVCFSSHAQEMLGGVPPDPAGGTDLAGALKYAKKYDGLGLNFICISDGAPDSQERALDIAKGYQSRISTIFVGEERDQEARLFLKRLADISGGQATTAEHVHLLAEKVRVLMLTGNAS